MKLATLLKNHDVDNELYEFSKNLTLQEFYETCPRGDWLFEILTLTHPNKENELRLAAAHCANTVRHLMKDKRSTNIIDYVIDNNGKKPPLELIKNAKNAVADVDDVDDDDDETAFDYACAYACAATAAYNIVDYNASYAIGYSSAHPINVAGYTLDAVGYYADATVDYNCQAVKKQNQLKTADICRQFLKIIVDN
jgi:Mg2+/Co2+ transporter CorC